MAGPLSGIKVLGFTHFAQAPFALQLLGDFGADIINIERPGVGDFNRNQYKSDAVNGEGLYFLAMNRNKRSVALNLKAPESKEIVTKLIKQSDVLVSNFRPGVLEKLGFGFEDVKKINPTIIYAEATGYGSSGPYADRPGQDLMGQSLSGYTYLVGHDGPPQTGGTFVADMYSAILLAASISAALVNKLKGGKAQKVEVNLLNSALHLQSQELTHYLNTGILPSRPKNYSSQVQSWAPYGIYPTKDGYICLSVVAKERIAEFGQLLGIDGLEKLMPDEDTMFKNRDELFEIISARTKLEDSATLLERLQAHDFWCSRVNNYADVEKDPQVLHNQIIKEIDHPRAGKIRVVGCPVYMSETPPEIRSAPPLLGQHTEEVLMEIGYSKEQIETFKKNNVI